MLRSRLLSLAPRCVVKTPCRLTGGDGSHSAWDYDYDESKYTGISYYFNTETPRGRVNFGYLTIGSFWSMVYYFIVYRPRQKREALAAAQKQE